jgi:hypothetical protein
MKIISQSEEENRWTTRPADCQTGRGGGLFYFVRDGNTRGVMARRMSAGAQNDREGFSTVRWRCVSLCWFITSQGLHVCITYCFKMMDDQEFLKKAFDKAQSEHAEKLNLSSTESDKFKKAFDDPEFRKMFSGT